MEFLDFNCIHLNQALANLVLVFITLLRKVFTCDVYPILSGTDQTLLSTLLAISLSNADTVSRLWLL